MAEILTEKQLARRYGVSAAWVREQARAGNLPHLPAGTKFLFNSVAVAEALASLAAQFPAKKGELAHAG